MRRGSDRNRRDFVNRPARLVGVAFGAAICFIGLGGLLVRGGQVGGLISLVIGALFASRCVVSSSVSVDDGQVTTRSLFRTRRYAFDDLQHVDVVVGATGLNLAGREYLVFKRSDGSEASFRELNCRPPKRDNLDSLVRSAAKYINERLI
jgi:hypothetical protein